MQDLLSHTVNFKPHKVAVLGAGTMGRGIAQVFASAGSMVCVYDIEPARVEQAIRSIQSQLERNITKGTLTLQQMSSIVSRVSAQPNLNDAVSACDLIIEAAPENLELKVKIFNQVVQHAPSTALLASNTSSLSITELGSRIQCPERTIGLHFFNPPPVMQLLEIVRGYSTSQATLQQAHAIAQFIQKTPIFVNDSPGFATSRLGVILAAEAIRMLEAGVASVSDLDRAMELGYRHPMGPLKLTDLVGLDVRLAILEHLHREVGEQFRPPALLRKLVRAGHLGQKSGRGFYEWAGAQAIRESLFLLRE